MWAAQVLLGRKEPQKRKSSTALMVLGFNMGLVALSIGGNIHSVPWTNEIIYLVLMLLCIPVVALDLAVAWSSASWDARGWCMLAVLGLLLCAIGQPLETVLCNISGSNINAVHSLFAGCDIMFLGLAGYLKVHNRAQGAHLAQQHVMKQD
ncbi:hypothetical protein DUNSADRAFT_11691 [Dunaliella salina]|uniref:Uncharacterized protein n=1 Tax=Dunaliella salina TaxID=3046 RepID=A0ABQ7H4D3_DUNSA|nr:hypothetical protein DUNSADRAFT_11691 [Dunaliella salina]|eukprot:KAF5841717.1 hypothetical protein DUNSADRAFT_11691 [Dunaliella salina]